MPYSFLPQPTYLTVNGDLIEFVHEGKLLMTLTPGDARSNASDLLEAADRAEGIAPSPAREIAYELQELIRHGGKLEPPIYRVLALLLEKLLKGAFRE